MLLLVGRVYCCYFTVCIVVVLPDVFWFVCVFLFDGRGFCCWLGASNCYYLAVFILVGWHMYFCWLAWLFFLVGRLYYCLLNVCIVPGLPCVIFIFWLCILLLFCLHTIVSWSCVLFLVRRIYCCCKAMCNFYFVWQCLLFFGL